jgi:hypothetical protein
MTLKRALIALFSIVLTARMLTELPRVFRDTGWLDNDISDNLLNRIFTALLILVCIFFSLSKKVLRLPLWTTQASFILGLFFILSIMRAMYTFNDLQMPFSGIFVVSFRFLLEWVLVIFVINFFKDQTDLNVLFSFFYKPCLFLLLCFGVIQLLTSKIVAIQGVDRLTGPFGSPNTFAGFLHLFIALTLYIYHQNRTLFFWLILGILYILMFTTGSIAAIGAHLFFLLMVGFKEKWFKSKRFYLLTPIILLLMVAGLIYKMDYMVQRLSILFETGTFRLTPGSSIAWRFMAWEHYLSLLGNDFINWMGGLGIGTQRHIFLNGYPNNLAYRFEAPGTHNDYITLLVDFGLIGVFIFFVSLILLSRALKKLEIHHDKIFYFRFYLYSLLVVMMSENFIDQLNMFVFLTIVVAVLRVHSADRSLNSIEGHGA